MEQESQPNVKEIFSSLSENGKKLLISMSHASHKSGMRMDAIIAVSQMDEKELQPALGSLVTNKLVQSGRMEGREFVSDEKGDRFRLPLNIKRSVLEDIVGLDKNEVESLLKY